MGGRPAEQAGGQTGALKAGERAPLRGAAFEVHIERPNPYARRTERTLAPRHSPAPKAPEKALALRKRAKAEPINLEQARVLKSVRPAAARIAAA